MIYINKKQFTILLLSLTIATSALWANIKNDISSSQNNYPLTFQASDNQKKAYALTTALLNRYHYKKIDIDNELSNQIMDSYLERLDPNRMFFLAADIKAFERYKNKLDEAIKKNDMRYAFGVFNIYQQRVAERINHAVELTTQTFDFTIDESYQLDRSELDWAKDTNELNEIWRKRIKNDALNLILAEQQQEEIAETLSKRYQGLGKRIAELNSDDAFEIFMNAYTNSIEPHTGYMAPRTSENFKISMRLSLEGIGAVLQRENEHTTIQRIVAGGPAGLDGRLQKGDKIVSVAQGADGEKVNVVGWRLDDVVELIRGPKDTIVKLEILPTESGLSGPSETISIVRNKVKLEEQAAQKSIIDIETTNNEILKFGIIEIPTFYIDFAARSRGESDYKSTTRDVTRLINELKDEKVNGVVIDLRNNGGGSLDEATALTGLFINKGPIVQVKNSTGKINIEKDPSNGSIYDGPLAVLVNRYSASASEIFAAAIQDYNRGIIIGEQTYGKGTVQNLIDLDRFAREQNDQSLGQLRVTIAQFFRINGGSTQHVGVVPDITFPSIADPSEFGESSYDNALPWTNINPAKYKQIQSLNTIIEAATIQHQTRSKTNREFQYLEEDIQRFEEARKNTTVSLLKTTREQEIKDREKQREQREQERSLANNEPNDCTDPSCLQIDLPSGLETDENVTSNEEAESTTEESNEETDNEIDFLLKETANILADTITYQLNEKQLSTSYAQNES